MHQDHHQVYQSRHEWKFLGTINNWKTWEHYARIAILKADQSVGTCKNLGLILEDIFCLFGIWLKTLSGHKDYIFAVSLNYRNFCGLERGWQFFFVLLKYWLQKLSKHFRCQDYNVLQDNSMIQIIMSKNCNLLKLNFNRSK